MPNGRSKIIFLLLALWSPSNAAAFDTNGLRPGMPKARVIEHMRELGYQVSEISPIQIYAGKQGKADSLLFCSDGKLQAYSIALRGGIRAFIR